MSVARPSETGCRLVRIKRVPSSDFQQPIPVTRFKNQQQQHHYHHHLAPPVTMRNHPASSSPVNRNWINQRHPDVLWRNHNTNRLSAIESSPRYYQVDSSVWLSGQFSTGPSPDRLACGISFPSSSSYSSTWFCYLEKISFVFFSSIPNYINRLLF